MIDVVAAGAGVTVQDLGRPGWARLGIGRSGAADLGALRLANRLVGNPETAAGLEITFGNASFRFTAPGLVALTGAVAPLISDAPRAGWGVAFAVMAGGVVTLGSPAVGLRSYLALAGGVAGPEVLGSRSTDTLSGLGPAAVRAGVHLPVGEPPDPTASPARLDAAVASEPAGGPQVFGVVPGPRADWTDLDDLWSRSFEVRSDSDRIGVRLHGEPLLRRAGEVAPEGMVRGAIQLPPDGRPIVLGPDHPVTGGYPVVGVVVAADLDRLGQLRPGDTVRFRAVPAAVPSRP